MLLISDPEDALAVLDDPRFVVPTVPAVPPGSGGVAWLRASVGRFSSGPEHERRRALSVSIVKAVPRASLQHDGTEHPVAVLARAMDISAEVVDAVRDVAQAYQPGTGDDARADAAVEQLVNRLGGMRDEWTAARIGVLVQACDATAVLIERAREQPLEQVLRERPPVVATKRQAVVTATVGGVTVEAGQIVRVGLAGPLAFGAGPRRCPGREHALALVENALASGGSPSALDDSYRVRAERSF